MPRGGLEAIFIIDCLYFLELKLVTYGNLYQVAAHLV